jgi:hypothetical protein
MGLWAGIASAHPDPLPEKTDVKARDEAAIKKLKFFEHER